MLCSLLGIDLGRYRYRVNILVASVSNVYHRKYKVERNNILHSRRKYSEAVTCHWKHNLAALDDLCFQSAIGQIMVQKKKLANLLETDAAFQLREILIQYAADTNDYTVSSPFVKMLRSKMV